MSSSTYPVPCAALSTLTQACFERLGLTADDAATVADVLVDANLRGNDSHGIARVPAYMRLLAGGRAGGSDRIREAAGGGGALRRLDAGAALGPIAARQATALAIGLARSHGVGVVAVGNSTHFGAAGAYVRQAAAEGLIALVATNGPATMAPHGSSEPFLGTNAFAIGAPLPGGEAFVLDMACSVAARGRVIRANELGEPLDPGIAIDARGEPTTDAAEALLGAVLPLGGPKGTGLALAVSLAVAILGGASFDHDVGRSHSDDDRPQNLGHLVVVIDPWQLAEREDAEARLLTLIERLHALRPVSGLDRVLYPGERGESERKDRLRTGIPIVVSELEAIAAVCDELGHPDLAARARALALVGAR